MTRWEYTRVEWDWTAVNTLGDEGWEAVGIVYEPGPQANYGRCMVLLKRPLRAAPKGNTDTGGER